MKQPTDILSNENGSALMIVLLIMVAILIMGIFSTQETTTELQIAGADLQVKKAFYEADGGTEYGAQLLEENIACYGFDPAETYPIDIGKIKVNDDDFWSNTTVGQTAFYYPNDASDPRTNIQIVNEGTTFGIGGAVQMTSGYEGIGKSAGSGGAKITFTVSSIRQKNNRNAGRVTVQWRHVIGQTNDCRYR